MAHPPSPDAVEDNPVGRSPRKSRVRRHKSSDVADELEGLTERSASRKVGSRSAHNRSLNSSSSSLGKKEGSRSAHNRSLNSSSSSLGRKEGSRPAHSRSSHLRSSAPSSSSSSGTKHESISRIRRGNKKKESPIRRAKSFTLGTQEGNSRDSSPEPSSSEEDNQEEVSEADKMGQRKQRLLEYAKAKQQEFAKAKLAKIEDKQEGTKKIGDIVLNPVIGRPRLNKQISLSKLKLQTEEEEEATKKPGHGDLPRKNKSCSNLVFKVKSKDTISDASEQNASFSPKKKEVKKKAVNFEESRNQTEMLPPIAPTDVPVIWYSKSEMNMLLENDIRAQQRGAKIKGKDNKNFCIRGLEKSMSTLAKNTNSKQQPPSEEPDHVMAYVKSMLVAQAKLKKAIVEGDDITKATSQAEAMRLFSKDQTQADRQKAYELGLQDASDVTLMYETK